MKQIVIATDLSERSDRALERGLELASALNAECTVVSVVDESLPADIANDVRRSKEARLRDYLDAHKGGSASVDVRIGDVVPGILGMAADLDADLLVLGLHRQREFMDAFRQTTMERIVALSRHPVLLVRDAVTGPYERVLVAVNFSKACAAAVSAAGRIAPGAEMVRLHALHVPFAGLTGGKNSSMAKAVRREAESMASVWKSDHGLGDEGLEIVTGSVHEVLDRKLGSFSPQLLAIGAHNRSGPGFHRIGSFAAELIRHPPVDLLVARG
ncbi:MAG: universal stress protein [Silicimonas sp.]|nr:universal stress protein [Silicimonas sp.]NNL73119.1 universal stress protein [Silicimonas sp.]